VDNPNFFINSAKKYFKQHEKKQSKTHLETSWPVIGLFTGILPTFDIF